MNLEQLLQWVSLDWRDNKKRLDEEEIAAKRHLMTEERVGVGWGDVGCGMEWRYGYLMVPQPVAYLNTKEANPSLI